MILMIFKKVILLTFFVNMVCGDCRVGFIGETIIEKMFGFNRIYLTKVDTNMILFNGEKIIAYCETGFRQEDKYLEDQIEIKCNGNYAKYSEIGSQQWLSFNYNYDIHCNRASGIALYESAQKLANCEKHTSLAIGASAINATIYAGVCYNWNSKDLMYVNYVAYKTKNMIYPLATKENEYNIKTVTKDIMIKSYESNFRFMSEDYFAQSYASLKENYTLLKNFEFDYSNLMQDAPLKDVFEKYDDILSIIWWRNLRLINWRTFLDMLEERSKMVKYDVVIGTSGEVYIPNPANSCKGNGTLAVVTEDKLRKVAPVNIWAHLTAISGNSTDDFVVIGYNTPFFTSYDSSNIMCEDICESIEWMRTFGKARLMPTMGLIICCRPADVADKLDNFPWPKEVVAAEPGAEQGAEINSWSLINTTPYAATSEFNGDYDS